jgi:hypothetical protein
VGAVIAIDAHKPVTSKYTFSEDVAPIVRSQCGSCHLPGGIAPMSLLTYEDARPWAESIRFELTSGHMPPWYGDPGVAPLKDVHKLSPRDLDVVLTWVTGGTPPGPLSKTTTPAARRGWSKGRPDLLLPMPSAASLPADMAESTREFVLEVPGERDRTIAFADLQPGNPAIVHDATIFTRKTGASEPSSVVATWLPGGAPVMPGDGLGFLWAAGEQLVLRIHYKKNWKLENKPASDRSSVGLYLTKSPAPRAIRGIPLLAGRSVVLDEHVQGVAVRSMDAPSDAQVVVDGVRPDGSRVAIAAFSTRSGWDQRYWLARPVDLPKGTRLEATSRMEGSQMIRLWVDAAPAAF